MALYEIDIPTDKEDQVINISISFNKDTYNWATSKPMKKGYKVVCVPQSVARFSGHTIRTTGAFTGFYEIILEADRQSKKRLEEAIELLNKNLERYLQYFVDTYNYVIPKLEEIKQSKTT